MAEWTKMAEAGLVADLLAVMDSLDSGVGNKEVDLVRKQLVEILKKHGLEEIKAVGEKFNPEFHEAVEQVESGGEEGIVMEEAQKGYLLNGRVIRVAKVKVSQ